MSRFDRVLVWFRRDLRTEDHSALHHALRDARAVSCVFVFDTDILDRLDDKADRRVEFIWHAVDALRAALERLGGGLHILHGRATTAVPDLARSLGAGAVYMNHDYEPAASARDALVERTLRDFGCAFLTFKDTCVFEKDEILTQSGKPYTVFTPYKNAWLARVRDADLAPREVRPLNGQLVPVPAGHVPSLEAMGFRPAGLEDLPLPAGEAGAQRLFGEFLGRMDHYHERRDYPAVKGPSYLSVHLRFGTISVRALARAALERGTDGARSWLAELVWREFYFQILWHFPHVVDGAFKREFDALPFENREDRFEAWCTGRTGYPIVDAAMAQINTTGYMHNRLRMIAASFLVKDLLVDWRWGERYFARKLNDFDLAANNGGWQWAASTGCDAQPYFRIFNPVTQSEKFDPRGAFIRRYVPVLANVPDASIHAPWRMSSAERLRLCPGYPEPIVDHAQARAKALALFATVRSR